MINKCIVCDFDKKVNEHHLQKVSEFGSDENSNMVSLCPNHHWIADFGDAEDKRKLLNLIFELTGKKPLVDENKQRYYEKLIRANAEWTLGKFTEEQWEDYKQTSGYETLKRILTSRPSQSGYNIKSQTIKNCEIKYLIMKLEEELKCQRERR